MCMILAYVENVNDVKNFRISLIRLSKSTESTLFLVLLFPRVPIAPSKSIYWLNPPESRPVSTGSVSANVKTSKDSKLNGSEIIRL